MLGSGTTGDSRCHIDPDMNKAIKLWGSFNKAVVLVELGNRTPVRFGSIVRDTTIPEVVVLGIHTAGSVGS